jgi:hypothetical protein
MLHHFSSHVVFFVAVEMRPACLVFSPFSRQDDHLVFGVMSSSTAATTGTTAATATRERILDRGGHDMYVCTPYGHVVQAALRLEE